MVKVQVKKRGKTFQYTFEIAPQDGKRKWISKSGFKSKPEAERAGIKALNEYLETGHSFKPSQISYSDYLDYWMKEYFEINYKYFTAKRYKESFSNIKKELGNYKLSKITPYILNQALLRLYQTSTTKEALRNYQKVIKSSLRDATYYFEFIKNNPASDLQIPRVLLFEDSLSYNMK